MLNDAQRLVPELWTCKHMLAVPKQKQKLSLFLETEFDSVFSCLIDPIVQCPDHSAVGSLTLERVSIIISTGSISGGPWPFSVMAEQHV